MKDLWLLVCICVIAIGLGAALFFFGPPSLQTDVQKALQSSQAQSENVHSVKFTILEQGTQTFSIAGRTNYRITSEVDLETLWPLIYGYRDTPNIPSVDFSKYEVLAIFDGTHTTSGYSVQATSVTDQNPTRTLSISHIVPSPTCKVSNGLNEPFEIIEVPATTFTLAHLDVTATSTCN